MTRFIEGQPREQAVLFPEHLDDWIAEDNPVRAVDAFVEELNLQKLGFESAEPAPTGRPAYHPATLLKIYIYGYLNRIQSSRRLERESQRNVELIWLTGRLAPDFKTIADFRRDNGPAIRKVCAEFVELCREIGLFSQALVVIDGSKFKAVNNRDKNFTPHKLKARQQQLEQSVARYFAELDRADRDPSLVPEERVEHFKEKIATVRKQMRKLRGIGQELAKAPDQQVSLTDPDARSMATSGRGTGIVGYNVQTAVDSENHLIVAHDVVNQGHDREQRDLAHDYGGGRAELAQVLVIRLPEMPNEKRLHTERLPPDHPVGTRGCARENAGAPRSDAPSWQTPATDRRAHVRNAEILDGRNPLPDENASEGQNGNELARSGI